MEINRSYYTSFNYKNHQKKPWKKLLFSGFIKVVSNQWVSSKTDNAEDYFLDIMVGELCRNENKLLDDFIAQYPQYNNGFSVGFTYDYNFYNKPSLLADIINPTSEAMNTSWFNYTKVNNGGNSINYALNNNLSLSNNYSETFVKYFQNQNFQVFNKTNTLDQCYNKYFKDFLLWVKYFNPIAERNTQNPVKNFINVVSYLGYDNTNFDINNNLYWITRGPNGNLMGVRGPYKVGGKFLYIGKYIDENGLIIDDNLVYFSQIPSLRLNYYKPKTINYNNFFYNKDPISWKCKSTLDDNNFFNATKSNKFFLCEENLQNLNSLLINGNNINKKTWNILGYVAEKIEDKNYFYNYTNKNYQSLNNIQWNVLDSFVNIEQQQPGYIWNINNFKNNKFNPMANQFNHRVMFLSWTMDLTLKNIFVGIDQSLFRDSMTDFVKYMQLFKSYHTSYLMPILSSILKDSLDQIFVITSYLDNIVMKLLLSNVKFGALDTPIINGMTFINNDPLDQIDSDLKNFFMGFNGTNFLWLKQNYKMVQNKTMDLITRIPNGTLWDSYLTGAMINNSTVLFPQTKEFFNLYGIANIYNGSMFKDLNLLQSVYNESFVHTTYVKNIMNDFSNGIYDVNEAVYGINFFNFQMQKINFLETNKFTNLNNNSFLNQTTFTPFIPLKNLDNQRLFNITELDKDLNLMGCNTSCFFLDFNGFPIKTSIKNPKTITSLNNFNGTDFLSFNWPIGTKYIFNNLNEKCFCQLFKINHNPSNNLCLICYSDDINLFISIKFIYDIEEKKIYYPYTEVNDYWIFYKFNQDKIYINKQSKIGFSTIFHQRYPMNYFSFIDPWSINIFDLNDKNITSINQGFIYYPQDHWIVLENTFNIKKILDSITIKDLWQIPAVVGNGTSGLVKICQKNDLERLLCADGDLESGIIYYSQNYNNLPIALDELSVTSITLGKWILDGRNNGISNNLFKFERTAIPLSYYNEDVPGLLITCQLIIDNWFNNIKISYALGNYCFDNTQKWQIVELLLYPQWDISTKKYLPLTSSWFLCLGNENNCILTSKNNIICDAIHCFEDGILLNNNYIDRLNDGILINILKNKYQLNIAYLLAIHPKHKYFLPSLINFSMDGLLTIPYELNAIVAYINRHPYFFYTTMGYQVAGTFFLWSLLQCINIDRKKIFNNTFYFHSFLLLSYLTWIIHNIILINSDAFKLDPAIYIYDTKSFKDFYILTGIHGAFLFFHLLFYLVVWINTCFEKLCFCPCLNKRVEQNNRANSHKKIKIVNTRHSLPIKKNNILLLGNAAFFIGYNLFLYFAQQFYPITIVDKKI